MQRQGSVQAVIQRCAMFLSPSRHCETQAIAPVHGPGAALQSTIASSQVAGGQSPLQSWVLYRRRVNKTPYPPLQRSSSLALKRMEDAVQPRASALYHFSTLRNMPEIQRWLALTPFNIPGGGHFDMHGNRYPLKVQKALDDYCVRLKIFGETQRTQGGSVVTHIWLRWKDIQELQPECTPRFLHAEPFDLPLEDDRGGNAAV